MVLTMPTAVSGLTKLEAASSAVVPSKCSMHCATLTTACCAYEPPMPMHATSLPLSACAAGLAPAPTTLPAPSLPTRVARPIIGVSFTAAKVLSGTGSAVVARPASSVPVSTPSKRPMPP